MRLNCFLNVLIIDVLVVFRSLGQEVFFSLRDADYEIASYAQQHSSMGILGQDSDFIIYDRSVNPIKMSLIESYKVSNIG